MNFAASLLTGSYRGEVFASRSLGPESQLVARGISTVVRSMGARAVGTAPDEGARQHSAGLERLNLGADGSDLGKCVGMVRARLQKLGVRLANLLTIDMTTGLGEPHHLQQLSHLPLDTHWRSVTQMAGDMGAAAGRASPLSPGLS